MFGEGVIYLAGSEDIGCYPTLWRETSPDRVYAATASQIDRATHYNWLRTDLDYEVAFKHAAETAV